MCSATTRYRTSSATRPSMSVLTQGWLRCFFFSSRRRHTRFDCDWSSDVCSSDLLRRSERLLLEEVVEAAADVAGACRVGRGIALDRHAERERGALVPRVLVGHALLNGLRTLEAPAGVEVRALAARVDRDAAVRALLERRRGDRQDGAARATPGDGVLGQHPTTSRSVGRRRRRRRRRPLRLTPLVPISLLSIFSVGHARGPFRSLTLPDAVAGAPVAVRRVRTAGLVLGCGRPSVSFGRTA